MQEAGACVMGEKKGPHEAGLTLIALAAILTPRFSRCPARLGVKNSTVAETVT
jgi:hypothetical protein